MPTVLRIRGYRFFFFRNEGNEPIHIHIERGDGYCKFWINPIALAHSSGFLAAEINNIRKLIVPNQEKITEAWNEYFSEK